MTVSMSTSYQLFKTSAPAITSVLPIIVNKKTDQFSLNAVFVKWSANQKPVSTGNTFEIKTIPLNKEMMSVKNVDLLRSFDITAISPFCKEGIFSLIIHHSLLK